MYPDSDVLLSSMIYRLGEYAPVFNQLSEFFKTQGWKAPQDEHNNPYTFTHKTGGLTMWEHVKLDPVYFADWNAAMNAQGLATSFAISIFPFHSELSKLETTKDSVLVVDVGGGLGHATMQIKALIGDVKGKVVLQDREEVLEDIKDDLGVGIEKVPHDFFAPNPVKGMYNQSRINKWLSEDVTQCWLSMHYTSRDNLKRIGSSVCECSMRYGTIKVALR